MYQRQGKVDHARWWAALLAELAAGAARHPGRTVGSVFFGGGTPSLMDPETAGALIADIIVFYTHLTMPTKSLV